MKNNLLAVIAIVVSVLGVFFHVNFLLVIVSFIIVFYFLPDTLFFSKRLFLSFSFYFVFITFLSIFLNFFKLNYTYVPLISSALLIILLVSSTIKKSLNIQLRRDDVWFFLIPIICLLYFIPSFLKFNNGLRIPIFSVGCDAGAHFNMFIESIKTKNVLFDSNVFNDFKSWNGWNAYPPAFYSLGSILYLSIFNNSNDLVLLTSFFSLYSILIFSLFILGLFFLIFDLKKYFERNKFLNPILFILFTILVIPFFFSLYTFGFYSQIISYFYLISSFLILSSDDFKFNFIFFGLLGFIFAISSTWYFNTPICVVIFFIFSFKERKNIKLKHIFLTLLIGLFAIYPVMKSLLTFNLMTGINANGGVYQIPYFYFVVGFYFWLFFVKEINFFKKTDLFVHWIKIYFLVSMLFSFFMFVFQIFTRGSLGYYFDKSLYTISLFLFVIFFYFIFKTINKYVVLNFLKIEILVPLLFSTILLSFNISQNNIKSIIEGKLNFVTKGEYNDLIFISENKNFNSIDYYPTGDFTNQVWAYAYLNRLPRYFDENYPVLNFDVSNKKITDFLVKEIDSGKKIVLLDNKNTQFFSLKEVDKEKAKKLKEGLEIYAGGW